ELIFPVTPRAPASAAGLSFILARFGGLRNGSGASVRVPASDLDPFGRRGWGLNSPGRFVLHFPSPVQRRMRVRAVCLALFACGRPDPELPIEYRSAEEREELRGAIDTARYRCFGEARF